MYFNAGHCCLEKSFQDIFWISSENYGDYHIFKKFAYSKKNILKKKLGTIQNFLSIHTDTIPFFVQVFYFRIKFLLAICEELH